MELYNILVTLTNYQKRMKPQSYSETKSLKKNQKVETWRLLTFSRTVILTSPAVTCLPRSDGIGNIALSMISTEVVGEYFKI